MNRQQWIRKFRLELEAKRYASSSINTYTSCLNVFFDSYNKYNGFQSVEDIKRYLITINNRNYHKQMVATIHHFYKSVVKKPISLDDLPYPRKTHYLPAILSPQEVVRLIACTNNIKHRALLQVMYSCGLRISEVSNIEVIHIDGFQRLLLVKGAKGFKDRYVPIPEDTLQLLRNYYAGNKTKRFLFEGQHDYQYSTRSIQQIFKAACRKAGIYKPVTPHSLRHSRATHLHDAGLDINQLKDFLGHNDIKTTLLYTHLSKRQLANHIEAADKIIQQALNNYQKQLA